MSCTIINSFNYGKKIKIAMQRLALIRRFLLPILVAGTVAVFISAFYMFALNLKATKTEAVNETQKLERVLDVAKKLVIEHVYSSMLLLKQKGLELGHPNLNGENELHGELIPNLRLGNSAITNKTDLVDAVTNVGNGTATIFVKKDNAFIRISTNVRKKDNTRAIGTRLDPNGNVIKLLNAGLPFYGVVDILGEPYITGYEPILDSEKNVIGAWYVGYKVDVSALDVAIKKWSFLESGFAAIADYNNKIRFLSDNINLSDAENILNRQDNSWFITSKDIPEWNFTAYIVFPRSDAYLNSVAPLYPVFIFSGFSGIMLMMLARHGIKRLVLTPLGGDPETASQLVKRISQGDFNDDNTHAEADTLIDNMLKMRARIREMVAEIRGNADELRISSSVFEHAHDGIFITDAKSNIIKTNPAFTQISGYSHQEALNKKPQDLGFAYQLSTFFTELFDSPKYQEGKRGEVWCLHKSGRVYSAWLDMFPVRNHESTLLYYVGLFSDNTTAKEQQRTLERLAYHDSLTQLPNRVLFANQLQKALSNTLEPKEAVAICYVDLDNFKPINDQYGHEIGDQLLVMLADRFRTNCRQDDTIARLGGDEFALLLSGHKDAKAYSKIMDKILYAIEQPFKIDNHLFYISASIGFTIYPDDNNPPEILLRHADHAMYHAKTHGGKQYHLFDLKLAQLSQSEQQIKQDILQALKESQFIIHYQPQVDLDSGRIIGMEALIRWQHPIRGFLNPNDFLPIIENTHLIKDVGEWVVNQVLDQIEQWQEEQLYLYVGVNIAAYHITDKNFVKFINKALKKHPNVSGNKLNIEITESAAISDIEKVTAVITKCNALGISFSLDDFGVGYSSLIYLRRLPVDYIKIDRSFTSGMLNDSEDMAVVSSVITLSKEFNRKVIAEGVETDEQLAILHQLGCHYAQGYGIAKPMLGKDVARWIQSNHSLKFNSHSF
ncbi:MAG: EAL domain-containing protein [Methylotenera sp.]